MSFRNLIITSVIFCSLIMLSSCDKKKETEEVSMNSQKQDERDHEAIKRNLMEQLEPTDEEKTENLKIQRAHAASLIKSRADKEPAYSMLTAFYYEPEFVFNGKAISKPGTFTGSWYKFEEDFTYTYGVYDEVKGSGTYHYQLGDNQMIMRDDLDSKMPEEWQVLTKEDVMVLVGKDYFQNNPRQMKMLKRFEQPTKS